MEKIVLFSYEDLKGITKEQFELLLTERQKSKNM